MSGVLEDIYCNSLENSYMSGVPEDICCYSLENSFSSDWAETFLSARFGPLGLGNGNKNFVCVCVRLSNVRMQSLSSVKRSQFWSYLYGFWYTCVSMGYLKTLEKDFWNFDFFGFYLDFWLWKIASSPLNYSKKCVYTKVIDRFLPNFAFNSF